MTKILDERDKELESNDKQQDAAAQKEQEEHAMNKIPCKAKTRDEDDM